MQLFICFIWKKITIIACTTKNVIPMFALMTDIKKYYNSQNLFTYLLKPHDSCCIPDFILAVFMRAEHWSC